MYNVTIAFVFQNKENVQYFLEEDNITVFLILVFLWFSNHVSAVSLFPYWLYFFPQSLFIFMLQIIGLFTVPTYIISLWIHLLKNFISYFLKVLFSPKHYHFASIMAHFNLKDREVCLVLQNTSGATKHHCTNSQICIGYT